jgi:hypothetical protein
MKKALKIIGTILLVLLIAIAIAWFGFIKPEPPPISAEDREALEVLPHSEHFSQLAHAALVALSDPIALSGKEDELAELCTEASKSFGATNLPISQHVQKLVQSATKN